MGQPRRHAGAVVAKPSAFSAEVHPKQPEVPLSVLGSVDHPVEVRTHEKQVIERCLPRCSRRWPHMGRTAQRPSAADDHTISDAKTPSATACQASRKRSHGGPPLTSVRSTSSGEMTIADRNH
jgi:hypothetical protein